DAEREAQLCSYEISQNVAVCGKTNSTNPGLIFYELAQGQQARDVERANCKDAKALAKYKLSTSCSYAPSLLAYYHVSRYLGNILQVPPSVVRTVDLTTHKDLGRRTV